jgi:hypothetical protein
LSIENSPQPVNAAAGVRDRHPQKYPTPGLSDPREKKLCDYVQSVWEVGVSSYSGLAGFAIKSPSHSCWAVNVSLRGARQ